MSERHFDRVAEAFMAEGPTVVADRVLDAALRDVRATRQRDVPGRRLRTLPRADRSVRVAVAVLMLVVGAFAVSSVGPGVTPKTVARIEGIWPTGGDRVLTWQAPVAEGYEPYLAGMVYDTFLGRSWSMGEPSTIFERAADEDLLAGTAEAVDAASRREFTMSVTPTRAGTEVLVPGQPLRIGSPVRVVVVGDEGYLARITRDASSDPYTVTARVTALEAEGGPTVAGLRSAGTAYPPGLLERYGRAAVPRDAITTDEARAVLDEIVALGGDNPYDLAAAAETLLRAPRFTYDTDVRGLDCGDLSIVDCFAVHRRGYCQYYATAMAILLRELDIPTRFVEGFRGGVRDTATNAWTVTTADAHAWVQVYFPHYGWIDFDPTVVPPRPASDR